MNTLVITPNQYSKSVVVPTSKSYMNRLLILGSLVANRENPFIIRGIARSSDSHNLIECLKQIGVSISEDGDNLYIYSSFPNCEITQNKPITLFTGDGGTTNRFLMALLALGKNTYILKADQQISGRPHQELLNQLTSLGANLESSDDYWQKITGPIRFPDSLEIDTSISTQFATALVMCGILGKTKFIYKNLNSSHDYLRMTESLVEQVRNGKRDFLVPIDFSSASYPISLGLLCDGIEISNCFERDFLQADSILLDIIENIGGRYHFTSHGLHIEKNAELSPITVDGSTCPDLVPTLIFIAAFVDGESLFTNLKVLEHKETNRFIEIQKILQCFAIKHDIFNDSIIVHGKKDYQMSSIPYYIAPKDHRMVMMASLFMQKLSGRLENIEPVKKSFPNFFEIMGMI